MTPAATFVARGNGRGWPSTRSSSWRPLVATRFAFADPYRRFWSVASVLLWPGLVLGFEEFRGLSIVSGLVPLAAAPFIDGALRRANRPGARCGAVPRWPPASSAPSGSLRSPSVRPCFPPRARRAIRQAPPPASARSRLHRSRPSPPAPCCPDFMGPAILLHTPHAVVAAPYHRAVPELAAALRGLGGTEADLRRDPFSRCPLSRHLHRTPGGRSPTRGPPSPPVS